MEEIESEATAPPMMGQEDASDICHLLSVPREIRDMIYGYYFDMTLPRYFGIGRRKQGIFSCKEQPVSESNTALLRICKVIHEESAEVLSRKTNAIFRLRRKNESPAAVARFPRLTECPWPASWANMKLVVVFTRNCYVRDTARRWKAFLHSIRFCASVQNLTLILDLQTVDPPTERERQVLFDVLEELEIRPGGRVSIARSISKCSETDPMVISFSSACNELVEHLQGTPISVAEAVGADVIALYRRGQPLNADQRF